MNPKHPLLTIQSLHLAAKGRKGSTSILKGVDLSVHPGEVVALVGPSGSGKSLTALAVLGLLPQHLHITSGSIHFRAESLTKATPEGLRALRGKEIAMIFQDPLSHLNPTMSIGNQIAEALRLHRGLTRHESTTATYRLLEEVGIPSPKDRYGFYPFQLSGGQCQRVMIASALACQPALVLADEPTTALDPETQEQILTLIKLQVSKNNTGLLFITHDLRVANAIADTVAVMDQGVIVEIASKEAFLSEPSHPKSRELVMQYRRRCCG